LDYTIAGSSCLNHTECKKGGKGRNLQLELLVQKDDSAFKNKKLHTLQTVKIPAQVL